MAGKGGVGKTTVCATMGVAAARAGLDTLLVELEGHSILGRTFGVAELPYQDVVLPVPTSAVTVADNGPPARLRGRRITPDDALLEYLGDHGLDRVGGRLLRTGAIDVVATAAPGIRDLLALGKVRALEQEHDADLIIVDAPAAGHAITFLRSAAGLADSDAGGPVKDQADQVLAMLADDSRCQVILVTLAEETPINETIETAFSLEDDVGVALGPIVVNAVTPALVGLADAVARGRAMIGLAGARRAAGRHRLAREHAQQRERARLSSELPLSQIGLPNRFTTDLSGDDISHLATVFSDAITAGPV